MNLNNNIKRIVTTVINNCFCQKFATAKPPSNSSNIIVDPLYFKKNSFISKIINKYKTTNTLADLERTFKDFNRKKFLQIYLNEYNKFVEMVNKRQFRGADDFLSEDLFQLYKAKVKSNQQLPWSLQKASQMKIVQGRTHSIHLTTFKTTNRWYQLICEFTISSEKPPIYHIIQRNQNGKFFKIIKIDLL